jgi:hypothetical protein
LAGAIAVQLGAIRKGTGLVGMSFDISPKDYLEMVKKTHTEFRYDELSSRRLIACCIFANHLPEIVFAEYGASDPDKVHSTSSTSEYREYAMKLCPEVGIVRDLCDFGKHGPKLDRKSVQVANTGLQRTTELDLAAMAMGIPAHVVTEKLVITLKDGEEMFADWVVATVVDFWRRTFAADSL